MEIDKNSQEIITKNKQNCKQGHKYHRKLHILQKTVYPCNKSGISHLMLPS